MSDKQNFDVIAFLEERDFPTESVTIYTDEVLAVELGEVMSQPDSAARKKKLKALETKADNSKLVFHMRGIPGGRYGKIVKDSPGEDTDAAVLSEMVTSIESPTGAKTSEPLSTAEMEKILEGLSIPSHNRLTNAMNKLVVASLAYDRAVDAGFFQKS